MEEKAIVTQGRKECTKKIMSTKRRRIKKKTKDGKVEKDKLLTEKKK